MAQLKARRYAEKYRDSGEPIHLVGGVEFSRDTRNVVGFEVERGLVGPKRFICECPDVFVHACAGSTPIQEFLSRYKGFRHGLRHIGNCRNAADDVSA